MSGALIGGVVGAAIGFFAGGNVALGWMIGSAIGGAYDYSQIPDTIGPRLQDRTVQLSSYGAQIPIVYGAVRLAGNVIWPANFDVTEHQHSESQKGGPENVNFTYTASFALLLCEGPIAGIGRVWMNKKLMSDPNSGTAANPAIAGMTLYLGTETQEPDPLMVATDGSAPAYRGWAYIVFEDLELTSSGFGNRIPSVEVEVFSAATLSGPPAPRVVELGDSATIPINEQGVALVDPVTGLIWSVRRSWDEEEIQVSVNNDDARKRVAYFVLRPHSVLYCSESSQSNLDELRVSSICYSPGKVHVVVSGIDQWYEPYCNDEGDKIYQSVSADWLYTFSASPPTLLGVQHGFAMGGGYIQHLVWNPITSRLMGFCLSGRVRLQSPPLGGDFYIDDDDSGLPCNSGVSCIGHPGNRCFAEGEIAIAVGDFPAQEAVVLTPIYYCSFVHDITDDSGYVVIRFLANNALHQILNITAVGRGSYCPFYDPDRDRVIHPAFTIGALKTFQIIDIAALTVADHSFTVPAGADTSPTPGQIVTAGVYVHGKYVFGAYGTGEGSTLYIVDPDTLVCEYAYTYEPYDVSTRLYYPLLVPKDPNKKYLFSFDSETVKRLYFAGTTLGEPAALSAVVADLSTREPFGLDAADVNAAALTDTLDGYLVGQQMTRRQAIEPLMAAYFFDAVESDHQIKYVKRGGASVVTIPLDDRAAHQDGEEMPPHLAIERVSELELPWTIDVSYIEQGRDYQVGTQYDRRITRNANDPRRLELAITMTAAKAKQVAMVNLYLPWLRTRFGFATTLAYAKYEPSDVVMLPTENVTYTARLTGRSDQGNGVIRWEAELEDGAIYTQLGTVAASSWVPQTINDPGATDLMLLDMPILRDADDNAGYYVAMGGYTPTWPGGQLFKSTDGGSSYAAMLSDISAATIGVAFSALGDFTAGNIFDNGNSVTVLLTSGGPLVSATETQVLNGSNTAVIGAHGRWEVINFKTATLIAAETYLLAGLLRGRRGTEWATGAHQSGDKFVLVSASTWQRPNPGSSEIGVVRTYKAPTFGTLLSAAAAEEFTNSAVGLEPYAPVDLLGMRDASQNLTISWHRRSRIGYGGLHTIVPLGEATESYSTDIMNGAVVVRTIASATPTASYTAAQQVTDGFTPGNPITVNVYQISATVARGYALSGTA